MDIDEARTLMGDMSRCRLEPQVRLSFEYSAELEEFLKNWGYFYCIHEDAFGVQITVSDRKPFAQRADGD